MRDETRLIQTGKLATLSDYKRYDNSPVKVACSIYKGNSRIAASTNERKTHPIMHKYNREYINFTKKPFLHAEMNALLQAGWREGEGNLEGCTLYVARKLNVDGFGEARPCPTCMAAIIDSGIKKIVYTNNLGYTVKYLKNLESNDII